MSVQVDPYTAVNGNVIDALEINARFDKLYNLQNGGIDGTNLDLAAIYAWTGRHSFTNTATTQNVVAITASSLTTGSALNITSNSADVGSRFLANIINDNAAATGAVVFRLQQDSTGDIVQFFDAANIAFRIEDGGHVSLRHGADLKVYSDAGATLKFDVDGATGDTSLVSGAKLRLNQGTTFITESAAGSMAFRVLNTERFVINDGASTVQIKNGTNLAIPSAQNLYLDGGGDSFVSETSANVWNFTLGGSNTFRLNSSTDVNVFQDFTIESAKKIRLNGTGGTTFITESVAGSMAFRVSNNERLVINDGATAVQVKSSTLAVETNNRVAYNIGATTYDTESAASVLDRYAGNTLALRCTTTAVAPNLHVIPLNNGTQDLGSSSFKFNELFLDQVDPPTANALNANSGAKAYANFTYTYNAGTGSITAFTINGSYNVSGIAVDIGAPNANINVFWGTDFANTNYTVLINNNADSTGVVSVGVNSTDHTHFASQATIGGTYQCYIVAYGDQ